MIIVTGAAGFIGSNVVADLEEQGRGPIIVSDWFGTEDRWRNIAKRNISAFLLPEELPAFIDDNRNEIKSIIHMGANSSTTERDADALIKYNINATITLWERSTRYQIPFIYASSAAIYGAREAELLDSEEAEDLNDLRPLNAYGWSKKAADQIILSYVAVGHKCPPQWVGLRFFNVYGPNEYHKGEMRSVAAKIFDSVRDREPVRLFKSERQGIADGQQMRDFIYVKDCTKTITWLLDNPSVSGIFNLGTGKARSFSDLVSCVGLALNRKADIEFVDMPDNLRGRYQYFTQAEMGKIRGRGLNLEFHSLEDGIADYVKNYLNAGDPYR